MIQTSNSECICAPVRTNGFILLSSANSRSELIGAFGMVTVKNATRLAV